MKLSYLTLTNAIPALNEISTQTMNYKTSLKISQNIRSIQSALTCYQEEMSRLMDKYVQKDSAGNYVEIEDKPGFYKLIPEHIGDYKNDCEELNRFEVEIDIYTIHPDEFEHIQISPASLSCIEFMIQDSHNENIDERSEP